MKKLNFKALTLPFFVAIIVLLPFSTTAQGSDGFFRANESENYQNRDVSLGMGLSNDSFGQAPLGTGLLVLTVAGAGYVALKRKRSYKTCRSYKTYMLALAMLLAFTGCKKKIEPIVNSGETVHITLNVGTDDKHEILLEALPGYSPVNYKANDTIYVGHNGKYQGYLVCQSDGGPFSGDITAPNTNDWVYFYFLGKNVRRRISADPTSGITESFTIDISNQKSNNSTESSESMKLPVLSMGQIQYVYGTNNYSTTLHNKCALVQFKFSGVEITDRDYKITNMLSEAKVDFANPGITPTGKVDAITLYAYSEKNTTAGFNNRWAILLPTPTKRHSYTIKKTGELTWSYYDNDKYENDNYVITIGEITEGQYIHGDNAYELNNTNETDKSLYQVSDNGNVVEFSPGNLQYQPSSQTWRFAENQWDFVGNASYGNVYATIGGVQNTKCDNAHISDDNYEGWIDLFGWGSWGYNNNPCNNSINNADYSWTGDFPSNVIIDGKQDWRSLTDDELTCFNNIHSAKQKIGKGEVFGVRCAIIAPINKTTEDLGDGKWGSLTIDNSNWETTWRNSGVLILPVTGYRNGTNVTKTKPDGSSSNMAHYYWLSTPSVNYDWSAWSMTFSTGKTVSSYEGQNPNSWGRHMGLAVRLVR
jgi:hypothetical protein